MWRLQTTGRRIAMSWASKQQVNGARLMQSLGEIPRPWVCLGIATTTSAMLATQSIAKCHDKTSDDRFEDASTLKWTHAPKPTIVFVLGGPGSGKGTQCERIVNEFGYVHLSAGDLLRAEVAKGTPLGKEIQRIIKDGNIVPSKITVRLLIEAMRASGKSQFLIDGFPRNYENRDAFVSLTGLECAKILFFDCPESVMEERLLKRGQTSGRVDDNIDSIRKRFRTFVSSSIPVVEHYENLDQVWRIDATSSPEQVYRKVRHCFQSLA